MKFRLKCALQVLAIGYSLGSAAAAVANVGSAQLVLVIDQPTAYVNGVNVGFQSVPRNIGGRIMLPLRETVVFLGHALKNNANGIEIAQLTIDNRTSSAKLAGKDVSDGITKIDGIMYISARLLSEALGANLSSDPNGRSITVTALRGGGNPLMPQARFATDKSSYVPGEKIIYTEYPFDPDGADITSRRWIGKQDVFFNPGKYTIGYQVTNSRGLQSDVFNRVIEVSGTPIDTPLSYALRYNEPGESFGDPNVLSYSGAEMLTVYREGTPLLFSDSPEAPSESGVLYQDSVAGHARLLAYHLNALTKPARLYILARNVENRSVDVTTERMGETAPTRVEAQLGQVTLLDYFASSGSRTLSLAPDEAVAVYASPTLSAGSGVNVIQDIVTTGKVELTFVMLEEALPPTQQVVQQLPYLSMDSKHQRGTFPDAIRTLKANITSFPARIVIGDGVLDPVAAGVDKITGVQQKLSGNYGVLYDLEISGVANTIVALSPRGGLYRGAMKITDSNITQAIKMPKNGSAVQPNQPVMLWRTTSNRINVDFIPASGSNLPVSLVFYRTQQSMVNADTKTYQP